MSASSPAQRTGRLAPSPTGRLHLGNLSSCLLAWVHARHHGARLVLRIEDLDPPRVVAGADRLIMADLQWLGIEWDSGPSPWGGRPSDEGASPSGSGASWYQSARQPLYARALAELIEHDLAYPCFCSRRDVAEALSAPHSDAPASLAYPGTCAVLPAEAARARATLEEAAWRFRARGEVRIDDGVAGPIRADLAQNPGDFIIARRDGLFAYQLAVVVDDAAMGVTDVVRGRDLLDSAPRQAALFQALGHAVPRFWHVPLLTDSDGGRLSKRRGDLSLDGLRAVGWSAGALRGAFAWLWGWQPQPAPLSPEDLVALWDPTPLDRPALPVPEAFFHGPAALDGVLKPPGEPSSPSS